MASQLIYDSALIYFSMGIDLARNDLLAVEATTLAEYYMHRAAVYEALGMFEHSQMDYHAIKMCDPSFVQRYHAQAIQLEHMGQNEEGARIREFL